MDTAYQSLLLAHGLSGLVALVTFWIAAFARKGTPLHLRAPSQSPSTPEAKEIGHANQYL